ncbi:Hypothetical predicted protein [Octopus vulgaris]|uniref:Uncharacterized protein n=1 Tax=Octopus vulgaris TaxID=6645 RepID=A0AA36FAK0_OCTVU|nr:Hypothetical predicted protein [Octopus vulgaris]
MTTSENSQVAFYTRKSGVGDSSIGSGGGGGVGVVVARIMGDSRINRAIFIRIKIRSMFSKLYFSMPRKIMYRFLVAKKNNDYDNISVITLIHEPQILPLLLGLPKTKFR